MVWSQTILCSSLKKVEEIFRSVDVAHRQEATLGSVSVITVACASPAHAYAAANIMQVEKLRFLCTLKMIFGLAHWVLRLEAWLDPAINLEWNPIRTGKGKPNMRYGDPTVKNFLDETALDPPVAGKKAAHRPCRPQRCLLLSHPGWRKPRPATPPMPIYKATLPDLQRRVLT